MKRLRIPGALRKGGFNPLNRRTKPTRMFQHASRYREPHYARGDGAGIHVAREKRKDQIRAFNLHHGFPVEPEKPNLLTRFFRMIFPRSKRKKNQ